MQPTTKAVQDLFIECYSRVKGSPVPPFRIEFYPYAGLRHTARVRNGKVLIRISDILAPAPPEILSALLSILLHKLFSMPAPEEHSRRYEDYIRQSEVRALVRRIRRLRGKKYLSSPAGRVYDLRVLYEALNRKYFARRLKVRHLSWSRSQNRRLMGHYDASHEAIVINRKLDHPCVPQFVVEYVLYHEMLHAHFGTLPSANGHRLIHHEPFRRAEREYPRFREASEFIDRHLTGR